MSTMAVIDGSSCFVRGWSVLPEEKRTADDLAYVVGRMIAKMVRKSRATHAAVALDAYPCWRYRFHPEYKGPREYTSLNPTELTTIIGPYLRRWGVPMLYKEGMEADDHLFFMATVKKPTSKLVICTRDSDLYCALLDPSITLLWPEGGSYHTITQEIAQEKLGFPGTILPQVRALSADQKDNIRGALGVPKGWRCPINRTRAAHLITEHGGLFQVIDHAARLDPAGLKPREVDYLREYAEHIVLMWQLTTLRTDVGLTVDVKDCDVRKFRIDIPEGK